MRKASWILLTIIGVLVLLISFASTNLAYVGDYQVGGVDLKDVAAGRDEVATGLRGIRGTSAAYGAAYAVLLLAIVLGPYRRGEVWAWWALLAAFVVISLIVVLRIPLIGTTLGVGSAMVQCGLGVFALLLDIGRLKGPRA